MLMKLYSLLFLIHSVVASVGDKCTHVEESDSTCVLFTDCEQAVRSVKQRGYHDYQRCGFIGLTEIVCCPETRNKFGSTNQPQTKAKRIADQECQKIIDSTTPPLDLHILGGEEASLGEFPHMVALGFDRGNGGYEFDCGGSLISRQYVLTAAHCVDTLDKIEPSIVRVGVTVLGARDWNKETDYRIANIKTHPDYTRREKYHDLTLIRLEKPVQFSSIVNAVCLYSDSEDPRIPVTITGWGMISNMRNIKSEILLKANVTVVSKSKCIEAYTSWRKLPNGITQEQLCAGDSDGIRDTCQGDSGGPLQGLTAPDGQYRIIGITSFGRGCGSGYPGIYTRVYNYLDWIESVVWPN